VDRGEGPPGKTPGALEPFTRQNKETKPARKSYVVGKRTALSDRPVVCRI